MKFIDTETPILSINQVIVYLEKDLANYKLSQKFNSMFAEAKKNQIGNLKRVIDDINRIQIAWDSVGEDLYKREAAAIYHGVTLSELNRFISRPINKIEKDMSECISGSWRQIPITFIELIDPNKEITKTGQVKTSDKPLYCSKETFKK